MQNLWLLPYTLLQDFKCNIKIEILGIEGWTEAVDTQATATKASQRNKVIEEKKKFPHGSAEK